MRAVWRWKVNFSSALDSRLPGAAGAQYPPMNTRLGIGAAQSLMGILQPGQLLAVGFGEATMSCLQHLSGFIGSQQGAAGDPIRRRRPCI